VVSSRDDDGCRQEEALGTDVDSSGDDGGCRRQRRMPLVKRRHTSERTRALSFGAKLRSLGGEKCSGRYKRNLYSLARELAFLVMR
jgi:hypothetical protein